MIKKSAFLAAAIIGIMPIIVQSQVEGASASDSPSACVLAMTQKWKEHDALGVANLFTADGDIVMIGGRKAQGHAAIQQMVQADSKLKTQRTTNVVSTRVIKPDVALVDYELHISGVEDHEGFPMKPMVVHAAAVTVKQNGTWLISAIRP